MDDYLAISMSQEHCFLKPRSLHRVGPGSSFQVLGKEREAWQALSGKALLDALDSIWARLWRVIEEALKLVANPPPLCLMLHYIQHQFFDLHLIQFMYKR